MCNLLSLIMVTQLPHFSQHGSHRCQLAESDNMHHLTITRLLFVHFVHSLNAMIWNDHTRRLEWTVLQWGLYICLHCPWDCWIAIELTRMIWCWIGWWVAVWILDKCCNNPIMCLVTLLSMSRHRGMFYFWAEYQQLMNIKILIRLKPSLCWAFSVASQPLWTWVAISFSGVVSVTIRYEYPGTVTFGIMGHFFFVFCE
jgi:hypothetical protein